MDRTYNLQLPLLAPAQAQKHVTHNEALLALDVLCQTSVLDRDCGSPPMNPQDGNRYLIPASPSQDANNQWKEKENALAIWRDGAWYYYTPNVGWIVFIQDEEEFVFWNGQAWKPMSHGVHELQDLRALGVGSRSDERNDMVVKASRMLWTARSESEGGTGDFEFAFNKESENKKLNFVFQQNYSDRIRILFDEQGALTFSVSPDGSIWHTALRIDPETARVSFPGGID
jgi:hypothetical protein